MKFENLTNEILNNNRIIKIFLSGSRLRVARVDDLDTKRIYGEGVHIMTALSHADENCIDNLDYQGQYGLNGKHDQFLTGGPIDEFDVLDHCLVFGRLFLHRSEDKRSVKISFVAGSIEISIKGINVDDALDRFRWMISTISIDILSELTE